MITVGSVYARKSDVINAVATECAGKSAFRTPVSDKTRIVFKCMDKNSGCDYHVRAGYVKKHDAFVVSASRPHTTCESMFSRARSPENKLIYLNSLVRPYLMQDFTTTAATIKKQIQLSEKTFPSRKAVWRACQSVKKALQGEVSSQFGLLKSLGQQFTSVNVQVEFLFELDSEERFKRGSFMLPGCDVFLANSNPRILLDATLLKGPYLGQLLICTALDVNNEVKSLDSHSRIVKTMKIGQVFVNSS